MTTNPNIIGDFVSLKFQSTAMKDINENIESPIQIKISFNKLINQYQELSNSKDEFTASRVKRILEIAKKNPELKDGFSDFDLLEKYKN